MAEEIDGSRKSLKYALASQIFRIIHRLVKLEYSPAVDPRKGWRRSIRQARMEIGRILGDSPSLRRELAKVIADETRLAIEYTIQDLRDYDELDRHQLPSLRTAFFTEEQILSDWFPEE